MYFSVISPEQGRLRQAASEMPFSVYKEHQWLWKFFADDPDQPRDFIYRKHEAEQLPRYYVVSSRPLRDISDAWGVQSREYDPRLSVGQQLQFQLCANPVVTVPQDKGRGKRHDVVTHRKKQLLSERGYPPESKWKDWPRHEDRPLLSEIVQSSCADWLRHRSEQHGFAVQTVSADSYRKSKVGKDDIQISTVNLSGVLTVNDPDAFRATLFSGLGHAKAFGCGLLLVRPVA
ncbi:type I-E CRISPR-associated protein Cas6/Cse3/CasE [Oxalobacteraceae bacterium A2-2]